MQDVPGGLNRGLHGGLGLLGAGYIQRHYAKVGMRTQPGGGLLHVACGRYNPMPPLKGSLDDINAQAATGAGDQPYLLCAHCC